MNKRGQVAIFAIIAIVLVSVIALFAYYLNQNDSKKNPNEINSQIGIINQEFQDCLSQISDISISEVGLQGGYNTRPDLAYDDEGLAFIAHHYYQGEILTPSKETIEKELSESINSYLPECIQEINLKENKNITLSGSKTTVKINPGQIVINSYLDSIIETNETISKGMKIDVTKYYPIYEVIEVLEYIKEMNSLDKDYICFSCIDNKVSEKDMQLTVAPYEDSAIYIITKNLSSEEQYEFRFLIKYD